MKIDLDFRFKPSKQDLINENEIVHKYKLEDIDQHEIARSLLEEWE